MAEEQAPPGGGQQQPTPEQEELLRRMEEEMRKVRVQDLLAQSVASLLNLAARRIAKEDERDLEQAQVGIEAVRAVVELLDPEPQKEVRNALSQVQVMFAKHSGGEPTEGAVPAGEPGEPEKQPPGEERKPPPGLWVPGSG